MTAKKILLVEDEALIAMMLEDIIVELGYDMACHADSVPAAAEALDTGRFDAAILDVNLGGERVWPIAERLQDAGIPFLLSTGASDNDTPARFADVPTARKPYSFDAIQRVLETMLG